MRTVLAVLLWCLCSASLERCREQGAVCGEEPSTTATQAYKFYAECPWNGITAEHRTDGFGAQLTLMHGVYLKSFVDQVPYCGRVWSHVNHESKKHDESASIVANDLFRFAGGPVLGPAAKENTTVVHSNDLKFSLGKWYLYPEVLRRLKEAYWWQPKPDLAFYDDTSFQLAVHIRRGDVYSGNSRRYDDDMTYSKCLSYLVPLLARKQKKSVAVHIFSEAPPGNHSIEDAFNITIRDNNEQWLPTFHLSTPVAETFHHMVVADAILIARSSFSRTAARLSQGLTFHLPDAKTDDGLTTNCLQAQ